MATTSARITVPYIYELRRMAVEMQVMPFRPGRSEIRRRARTGIPSAGGRIQYEPPAFGAIVYFDILEQGASGTRVEVLRTLEGLLGQVTSSGATNLVPVDVVVNANELACVKVAHHRHVGDHNVVSAPALPLAVHNYYRPSLTFSEEKAQELYAKADEFLTWFTNRWRHAWWGRNEHLLVAEARTLAHLAFEVLPPDDTDLHRQEMELLRQLRAGVAHVPAKATTGHRLITFD